MSDVYGNDAIKEPTFMSKMLITIKLSKETSSILFSIDAWSCSFK